MKFVAWMAYHLESRAIVDAYIARAREYLQGHEFVVCEDEESIEREIAAADVMLGWRITPEVFARARRLKWIQFGSAGIDHTIFPELLESDITLTTLSGVHTIPVAEHVLAQMLALARRLHIAMRNHARPPLGPGEDRFRRSGAFREDNRHSRAWQDWAEYRQAR